MIRFSLKIVWPEDADPQVDGSFSMRDTKMEVEAVGISDDTLPHLMVFAADSMQRAIIRDFMEVQNPLANGDLLDEMAAAHARLSLIDMILHLPVAEFRGVQTPL